jgi:cation channel sperm-associated protein 3
MSATVDFYDDEAQLNIEELDALRTKRLEVDILRRRSVVKELTEQIHKWQAKHDNVDQQKLTTRITQLSAVPARSRFHAYIRYITQSSIFENFIMICIFTNALFIAVETSLGEGQDVELFETADMVFLAIYLWEFVLKLYAEPVDYWRSKYNLFDFTILIISMLQFFDTVVGSSLFGSEVSFIRVLRAMRALRALRSISMIRALRVLVDALVKTFASVLNLLSVLLLITYVFAIMGFYFFGKDAGNNAEHTGIDDWATLPRAMYSLFSYVTADGWTDLQNDLDERGLGLSRLYTAVFIFIGHFIFTNLFIGVIIYNLEEAQEEERIYQTVKKTALVDAKKEILKQRQTQQNIKTSKVELPNRLVAQILHDMEPKLRRDDLVPMTHPTCNMMWVQTFVASLQFQENAMFKQQQLHFALSNTLAGILELRYAATQTEPVNMTRVHAARNGPDGGDATVPSKLASSGDANRS